MTVGRLVTSVRRLFDRGAATDTRSVGPDGGVSTILYACSRCDTTYVSEEMESCPWCSETVESIPNGYELGFVSTPELPENAG